MRNCMTYALLKGEDDNNGVNPDIIREIYSPNNIEQQLDVVCKEFGVVRRPIEGIHEKIEVSEWIIAFFGPFPAELDYEYNVSRYDYHFMLYKDSSWSHRSEYGAEVSPADEKDFDYFKKLGYPPQFFAIKEVAA